MSVLPLTSRFVHLSPNDMKRLAKEMTALVVSGISKIACELAWYQLRKHSSNQNFEPRAVLSSQLPISTINDIDIRDILGDPLMRSYIVQEIVLWLVIPG
jgi:hypothetical protein